MFLTLDKTKKRSYTNQIYSAIRNLILSGELEAGDQLPSSRDLSRDLSVSRNTVLTAYDMLVSEGAVESIAGSGFFVRSGAKNVPQKISIKNQQTASLSDLVITDEIINFDSGHPALDLFPVRNGTNSCLVLFLMRRPQRLAMMTPKAGRNFVISCQVT